MTSGTESERLCAVARAVSVALRRRGETVAVAESCTGGWLGRSLTAEAGASDVFWGGVIAYADAAKVELAGVPPELIESHGAVSEPVARALAEGLRSRTGSDWTVAVTGVAGPGGGSDEKPVGTVWTAVSGRDGCSVNQRRLDGDRKRIRGQAVEQSLRDLLDRLERAP